MYMYIYIYIYTTVSDQLSLSGAYGSLWRARRRGLNNEPLAGRGDRGRTGSLPALPASSVRQP